MHKLRGLRLNLNCFHTTYQSQQAVYNLTYFLISLKIKKENLLVRGDTDTFNDGQLEFRCKSALTHSTEHDCLQLPKYCFTVASS